MGHGLPWQHNEKWAGHRGTGHRAADKILIFLFSFFFSPSLIATLLGEGGVCEIATPLPRPRESNFERESEVAVGWPETQNKT